MQARNLMAVWCGEHRGHFCMKIRLLRSSELQTLIIIGEEEKREERGGEKQREGMFIASFASVKRASERGKQQSVMPGSQALQKQLCKPWGGLGPPARGTCKAHHPLVSLGNTFSVSDPRAGQSPEEETLPSAQHPASSFPSLPLSLLTLYLLTLITC